MFPAKIAGLGWYLPVRRVTSAELERELKLGPGWIERVTGVAERRYATTETTVSLAADAAKMAIRNADLEPGEIDLIISASTGPQQSIPCTAVFVKRALGLPDGKAFCFDINATCLTFLVAFYSACQFVAQGTFRRILVVSSEVATHMRDFNEPESAVLLGDGAAAAVVVRSTPDEASVVHPGRFATFAEGADLTYCLGGGTLHHPNDPATTAAMNRFHMDGRGVFKMARKLVGPFLEAYLADVGVAADSFEAVIPHQASLPGVEMLERSCGFRPEQIVRNLHQRGNCVAASIPLALAEAVDAGRIQRGHKILLAGTGAGLSLGAVALVY